MARILSFALLFVFSFSLAFAETLIGVVSKNVEGNLQIENPQTREILILKAKGADSKYLESFLGYNTYLKFTGDRVNGEFIADRTPVIVSGHSRISGTLKVEGDRVFVGQQEVVFNQAKKVNGSSFNESSVKSFDKREVIANGKMEEGVFRISAIVPGDLFSANDKIEAYKVENFHSKFSKNPKDYILKSMPQNKNSQANNSFRGTIIGKGKAVSKTDHALVVTLSGRQGDDLSTANGHFAVGMAKVKEDLSLDMEIHNYYPTKNEKDIIPGFIDYVDYFGGLTSGQSNYRPTYTLIIYGESREKLLKMRDALGDTYARLRMGEDNFSASSNCTTVSVDGLNTVGIVGEHQRLMRKVLEPKNILKLNPLIYFGSKKSSVQQASFSVANNSANFIPRPAFESLLNNLDRLMKEKNLEGYRVDYVFQNQTPSDRAVGGIAANEFLESLSTNIQDSKHAKKPYTKEQITEILNKID